eukprot:CAMPEP_0179125982 /NCGR_PEP_ID=MMETSP0796-20121207/59613_1 /TAXON_ID=73915 /ORGANISM="Pyrodinium bahamense, Strain pbaha01" /LENGTH=179 /DNA_ID=CAMNT_0020824715 /DNA_START=95 /DNA_END=634 /DNA_ORIENTATION=+
MSSMFGEMFSIAKKMVFGKSHSTSSTCIGPTCCPKSSCWTIPMAGCKESRGDTRCVGASTFPFPKKGICSCESGTCNSAGKCTSAAPSGGGPFSRRRFSRLYEADEPEEVEVEEEVTPEEFTEHFVVLGTVGVSLLTGGTVLGLRFRRSYRKAHTRGRKGFATEMEDEELLAAEGEGTE